MKTYAWGVAAILFCVTVATAAERPDFTGVWKRGEGADTAQYTIDQQGDTLNIRHEPTFSGARLSGGMSGSQTYIADGVEKKADGNGRDSWTTVYWEGPSLVILRVVKEGYRVSVTRETWSISEDGKTLAKTRRRIDMDGVTSQTETYRKQ